jgi:hypothetical protein
MKLTTFASTSKTLGLALLLVLAVLMRASADQSQAETSQSTGTAVSNLMPLAARFVETRSQPNETAFTSDWFFIRSDTRIETAQKDYTEIWERDERQEITLKRAFHGDRKLIEYTANELRAQRRLKDWSILATILDQRVLERLEKRGETKVLKQSAVRYVGRLGDERVEVMWLTQQAIPAKLVRTRGEVIYTLELKELRQTPDASWPKVDRRQINAYESLDGADLGDREYDPFVQKVIIMDAARRGGHPHNH